jgi:exodeoxyribonuclease-5
MTNITFTEEQQAAIQAIKSWYTAFRAGLTRKQTFFLTGYAGTGKTTIARAAAEECVPNHRSIAYIAPTGKAAARLRDKGCEGARTLHSFAYNPRGEDEEGDPIFHEKDALDILPLLVVMDEASMVGEYDFNAVSRHGIPILALGDLGQLPPVKAPYSLTPDHVDFELTQILRQKAESNIIRAAGFVRQGKTLPDREYDDVRVRTGSADLDMLMEHSGEDAQILVSYNNTRVAINRRVREKLGFADSPIPQIGEKVMCTFNQHKHGMMNGEQGIIIKFEDVPEYDIGANEPEDMMYVFLRSLTDGKTRKVKFNPASFSDDGEVAKEAVKAIGGFAYGYACTVHKSQGSEWPNVLVIDEPMGDVAKLRYTAYTRAATRLTVYRRAGR